MAETFHPVYFYVVRIAEKQVIWHMHETEMKASLDKQTVLEGGPFTSRDKAEHYIDHEWRRKQPTFRKKL